MPHLSQIPGQLEAYGTFRRHLGPRFTGAGLGIQFQYNQQPGIHFKVEPPPEYREAILTGLSQAMSVFFPDFPASGSVWITRVDAHPADSSQDAFHQAARMVVEQALSLAQPRSDQA